MSHGFPRTVFPRPALGGVLVSSSARLRPALERIRPMRLMLVASAVLVAEVVNSWKDPSAAEGVKFQKIVTICQCREPSRRRTVEDQLAKRIGPKATPSYTLITDQEVQQVESAKAKVEEGGFDGAVVMQLANVDKQLTYVPGTSYTVASPYTSMWGGWGYGWSMAYDPGYVQEDQVVNFNTYVYSVADQKLLWASQSQTTNPSSIPAMVDEIISATAAEMKKQKVLTE
jgi:hypothetical protein